MITHNLSEENLLFAMELGGLSMPSFAIIDPSKSNLHNFGEIYFIGNEDYFYPKEGNPNVHTYKRDCYSPRVPKIHYFYDQERLDKAWQEIDDYFGENDLKKDFESFFKDGKPYHFRFELNYPSVIRLASKRFNENYDKTTIFNNPNREKIEVMVRTINTFLSKCAEPKLENGLPFNLENIYQKMKQDIELNNGIQGAEGIDPPSWMTIPQLYSHFSINQPLTDEQIKQESENICWPRERKKYNKKALCDFSTTLTQHFPQFKPLLKDPYGISNVSILGSYLHEKHHQKTYLTDLMKEAKVENTEKMIKIIERAFEKMKKEPTDYLEIKLDEVLRFDENLQHKIKAIILHSPPDWCTNENEKIKAFFEKLNIKVLIKDIYHPDFNLEAIELELELEKQFNQKLKNRP